MKNLKNIAASLLALSFVGAASAQTVIRITGSTAYRNATEQCIQVALKSGYVWGGVGKTIGATQMIFSGNLNNATSAPVIVLTAFTGSEGGIYNLTHPLAPPANATYIGSASYSLATTTGFAGFTSANARTTRRPTSRWLTPPREPRASRPL